MNEIWRCLGFVYFVVPGVFFFLCRATANKRAMRNSTRTTDMVMMRDEAGNSGM